jgi:hypothetical protein
VLPRQVRDEVRKTYLGHRPAVHRRPRGRRICLSPASIYVLRTRKMSRTATKIWQRQLKFSSKVNP